jgi:murein DD-endopeptidase MepM/ murein hydrolase activator NlpD
MIYPHGTTDSGLKACVAGRLAAPALTNGAAMTQLMSRAAVVALAAAALAACETVPQYPARAGYTPPAPLVQEKPQYATRAEPAPAAPAATPGEDAVAAHPPTPVESRPLPPPAPIASRELAQADPATAAPAAATPPSAPATTPAAPPPAGERAGELERMPTAAPPPASAAAPSPAATAAPPPTAAPSQPAYHVTPPQLGYSQPAAPSRPATRYAVAGKVVDGGDVFFDYRVSRGDHVDQLARDYNTTRAVIVSANRLRPPYGVRPGQILKMPVAKAYVVQSGDTLGDIAKRFSVSPLEIAELNHISSRAALRPGEKLGLPPSFIDRGPIRVAASAAAQAAPPPQPASAPPRGYTPSPTATAAYSPPPARPVETAQAAPPRPTYSPPPTTAPAYSPPPAAAPAYVPPASSSPPPQPYRPPTPGRPQTLDTSPMPGDIEIANAGRGRFVWPVRGAIVNTFGDKGVGRRNDGVDIQAPVGTVVHAAAAGYVVYAGNQVPELGNLVVLKHAEGWVTAYAHLDRISVKNQDTVLQGQELGQVGAPVGTAQPLLFFQVRYTTSPDVTPRPVNPVLVLPK